MALSVDRIRDRGCSWRRVPGAACWLLALALLAAGATAGADQRRPVAAAGADGVEAGQVAVLADDGRLYLEALPGEGEGLWAFARRLCGDAAAAEDIAAANGGTERLLAGRRYRVPFERLLPAHQLRVVRTLFPADRGEPGGWRHRAVGTGPFGRESLWHVARWFTGRGESFAALRHANGLADDELERDDEILIPAELLRPTFRGALESALAARPPAPQVVASTEEVPAPVAKGQPAATRQPEAESRPASGRQSVGVNAPTPRSASAAVGTTTPAAAAATATPTALPPASPHGAGAVPVRHRLDYDRDAAGEYAVYRLRPGEALYSSVVVRFTGRVFARDVNALAEEIAERSSIADLTDIPVGFPVKVPFELLLPEYLPADHPRRREYEQSVAASARFTNRVRVADLSGITVILDAGHGGVDVGASFGGVWESLYVYDIKMRVRDLLTRHTAAQVVVTTRDGGDFAIAERDVLPFSRAHTVLTDPPYPIADATVGTNLRWYLANSVYQRALAADADPQKVVFVSLHADSLHPSIRGASAYIPGAALTGGSARKSGPVYQARSEWRERPAVEFAWGERVESEGLSRQLAHHLMAAIARRGLSIHPHKPVREKIIRERGAFVPAVLRYNAVPAKVLLEVCNLANEEDRRLLQTRAFRQAVAEAVVEAILGYYGEGASETGSRVVARASGD